MARNEEKHAGRLNRLWLEKLDKENLKKNPPRPGLGSLKTADEVKKWIPSIKRDIDYCLKQSQVACYPERKLTEFSDHIEKLSREYKAYLRKYRELKPGEETAPWTDKPYARKHKGETSVNSPTRKKAKIDFTPIATPVLQNDTDYSDVYGYDCDGTEPNSPQLDKSPNNTEFIAGHTESCVSNADTNTCGMCLEQDESNINRLDSDSKTQNIDFKSKNDQNIETNTCYSRNCKSIDNESVSCASVDIVLIQGGNEWRDKPLEFNYFRKHRRHMGDVIFSDQIQTIMETGNADCIERLGEYASRRTVEQHDIGVTLVENHVNKSEDDMVLKSDKKLTGKVLLNLPYSSDEDSDS